MFVVYTRASKPVVCLHRWQLIVKSLRAHGSCDGKGDACSNHEPKQVLCDNLPFCDRIHQQDVLSCGHPLFVIDREGQSGYKSKTHIDHSS